MSANFRALFTLQFNQFAKHQKTQAQLWPLSFDETTNNLTADEMYARNRKIIDSMNLN